MVYNIDREILFILYRLKNRSRETRLMYFGYNEVIIIIIIIIFFFFTELSANKTGNFIKCGLLMTTKVCKQGYLEFLSVIIMNGLVEMLFSVSIVR